jgi:endonuclease/exonuclease/phosphatase family metal-dependent hydrolase
MLVTGVAAQWDPASGQWGKTAPTDLRVMTWNIDHGICSSNHKLDGGNQWSALVRTIAAMKPDVLLLQEAGDNADNGTGTTIDTPAQLEAAIHLLFEGGNDPFNGNAPITSWVQLYAPGYDLPYVFASSVSDGFERNAIASRFPFTDLNGDGQATLSDIPTITGDQYAPGGKGGIRGYTTAEIDLPDALYAGNLVIGNSHLKAGSAPSDKNQRIAAAKDIAYFIDYEFNGAGTGLPDPDGKIADSPPVTQILDPMTPVITGGDLNEDQYADNATSFKGPADWMAMAADADGAGSPDGTDRNRTDMSFDHSQDVFTGSIVTIGTQTTKFDYFAWQDSLASLRRSFVFNTLTLPQGATPPEIAGFPGGTAGLSLLASDHRAVIADFILMPSLTCNSAATDKGFAKLGSSGTYPTFAACGSLATGGTATFTIQGAPASTLAYPILSATSGLLNGLGGTIVPVPPAIPGPLLTDPSGQLVIGPVAGGGGPFTLFVQWAILDPGASHGVSFTNALQLDWLP